MGLSEVDYHVSQAMELMMEATTKHHHSRVHKFQNTGIVFAIILLVVQN
jgi:hypothetical protein